MAVSKSRPILWLLVPLLLGLAGASAWSTLHFSPIGKTSQNSFQCRELKNFILQEEVTGRSDWNEYRDLVGQYQALPQGSDKSAIVEEIALVVVKVLEHDLNIYYEMENRLDCLVSDKRTQLSAIIAETESAIKFLNGSEAIGGDYFDPSQGNWNPDYYNEFISATEFLISQAVADADL